VLHELDHDETGYRDEGLVLDADAVARGIGRILREDVDLDDRFRSRIAVAAAENDAGDIDAVDADVIAQVALLGEVRYG
jgi:hypothetical protein